VTLRAECIYICLLSHSSQCDLAPNPTSHSLLACQYGQLQRSRYDDAGLSCVHLSSHSLWTRELTESFNSGLCQAIPHRRRSLCVSLYGLAEPTLVFGEYRLTESSLLAGNMSRLSNRSGKFFEDKFLTGARYGYVNICA